MEKVAAALVDSDAVNRVLRIVQFVDFQMSARSRHGAAVRKHILPFRIKINQRRDVRLPWFHGNVVTGIEGVGKIVEILVRKPTETVPELMNHNRTELAVVGGRKGV